MQLLYAPWRSKYFNAGTPERKSSGCPFCSKIEIGTEADRENLILKRTDTAIIMLNIHPYNAGHLLIIPTKHTPELKELSENERFELMELMTKCISVLEKYFDCAGINIGINKGKISGGSIPDHLHIHVIPRFIGDTNFLVTAANTKVIPFDLYVLYDHLISFFS